MELGVKALEAMYLPESGLFPFSCRLEKSRIEKRGESVRYTAISHLGLQAARDAGFPTDLNVMRIMRSLVERLDQVENIGDLGLIAWCDGNDAGVHAEPILDRIERYGEFFRTPGSGLYASMELAWLLTGLLALHANPSTQPRIDDLIARAYRDLIANYEPRSGFFRFARSTSSGGSRLKQDQCFFAEQIYGIYALALYAAWSGGKDALQRARTTASRLVAFQGSEGQWAWCYHAGSGALLDRYPVYSVHQDGMAPMSLGLLSAVTGEDFFTPALRGLEWIMGRNELAASMVAWDHGLIWRSIRRKRPGRAWAKLGKGLALLGLPLPKVFGERAWGLEIDRECRPYHLGWMLVGLSGGSHCPLSRKKVLL
jgi:hypothetical protein